MALVSIKEIDPTLERLVIVDASNVVEQNINNETGQIMELTFVKDVTVGNRTVLTADGTVPIPDCRPGGAVVVTVQMINDAIAAGGHSDIYLVSKRENQISTVPKLNITVGGVTQPGKAKGKSKA